MEAALANIVLRNRLVMKVVGDLAWERATARGWTHDGFETFQEKRYDFTIELLKRLRAWWTRQADKVIVPSRYLARWVARWGVPEERIAVIYNALEPMNGTAPAPVPLRASVKAVTVGRLIPLKRVDQVLEAVGKTPGLGLVVVGDGPERAGLERIAGSLGLADRVWFAGACSHVETLGLMAACDLLILNSTHEGLPHVVLEAMALGLPVVATAVGGTPEVVRDGETGVLIPAEDESLSAVILRLVENQEQRKRFGDAASRWVCTHYTVERMVEQTEAILLQVA
jgi:glycosyltransferase involved in cell wall biosynthesis